MPKTCFVIECPEEYAAILRRSAEAVGVRIVCESDTLEGVVKLADAILEAEVIADVKKRHAEWVREQKDVRWEAFLKGLPVRVARIDGFSAIEKPVRLDGGSVPKGPHLPFGGDGDQPFVRGPEDQ